jgi:DNA primase catalytic core
MADLFAALDELLELMPTGDPEEFKARCPFHPDTHPSLYIHLGKGVWYCFGCQAGGTITTLLKRLGVEVAQPSSPTEPTEQSTLLQVLQDAQQCFQSTLTLHRVARYYLQRTNRERFCNKFGLGFCDPQRLRASLTAKYTDKQLVQAGLQAHSGHVFLANRITIPIYDINKRLVAFAGRALSDNVHPKYLNTPSTDLYRKRCVLYGAHLAVDLIKTQRQLGKKPVLLWLVEGYFDAMHLLAAGIPAVALCGTALSITQLRWLTSLPATICLALDPDLAGLTRALEIFLTLRVHGAKVAVCSLPEGKDVDQCDPRSLQARVIYDAPTALANLLLHTDYPPAKLARWFVQLSRSDRSELYRALQRHSPAYAAAVAQAIRTVRPRHKRPPAVGVTLAELLLAAIAKGAVASQELPSDFPDQLPQALRGIGKHLLNGEPLSEKDAKTLARLLASPLEVSGRALLAAWKVEQARRAVIRILEEAKTAPEEALPALEQRFLDADVALRQALAERDAAIATDDFLAALDF